MTPDVAERYRTGLIALAREQLEVAEPLLRGVVADAPAEADPLAYLATAWVVMGRVEAAREAMDLALTLGPDRFAPNLKGGELDLRLGDLDAATRHFRRALEIAPHGSGDAAAARTLLAEARRRASKSITRQAVLPRWGWPVWLHRSTRGRPNQPVEDGGRIE
jgi:tetratricopeptide (TPR) repeat protein